MFVLLKVGIGHGDLIHISMDWVDEIQMRGLLHFRIFLILLGFIGFYFISFNVPFLNLRKYNLFANYVLDLFFSFEI